MKTVKYGIRFSEQDSLTNDYNWDDEIASCLKISLSHCGITEATPSAGVINLQEITVECLLIQNLHETENLTVAFKDSDGAAISHKLGPLEIIILPNVSATSGHQVTVRTDSTPGYVGYGVVGHNPVVS